MKLWKHQLLVNKKPREAPFPSRDAAVAWARTHLAKEISERRVQILRVEAFQGAARTSSQRRLDRAIRKSTGFKNEAAYQAAWEANNRNKRKSS